MSALGACTWPIVFLLVVALAAGFATLVVILGFARLLREAGRSVWLGFLGFGALWRPGAFGAGLEVPRRRLSAVSALAFGLFSVFLLCGAALSVTCRV